MNRLTAALAACASLALLPGVIHAQNITSCNAGQICMSIDGAAGGGARVPLNTTPGRAAIAINPADGSVTVRSLNESVQQCTQVNTSPAITSFSATPSSVTPGSQITLSWTTSNVPNTGTPCQAVSGPPEWIAIGVLPSSGNRTVQANGMAPGTLTYGLRCTGTDGTQVSQIATVSLVTNPTNCSGQNAPPDGYATSEIPLCSAFSCVSGAFPPVALQRWIAFNTSESKAFQFTANLAPTAAQSGAVTTDEWRNLGNSGSSGSGVLSISACPHDYGTNLGLCRSVAAASAVLRYALDSTPGTCRLNAGGVYFFNMTSGSSATPGAALGHCSEYPCSALTSWRGFEQPRSGSSGD